MERGSQSRSRVKNKNAASVQITAEQLLREAREHQEPDLIPAKQQVASKEELDEYRTEKRKYWENFVRADRYKPGSWIRYAAWEEAQMELVRARSVFERALATETAWGAVWIKYAEMEMRHKNVNHARNVLDRAVRLLPRMDQFWYKYVWMEEMLGNIGGTRAVFDRWMAWEPDEAAWMAYVKFESRYKEAARARSVFERFVGTHPQPKNWLKWAKFEEANNETEKARAIYEACLFQLGEELFDSNMYISFAKFETRHKELDRAKAIYKFALAKFDQAEAKNLYTEYTLFEKQFGDRSEIEDVVMEKRRQTYEEELTKNPLGYDTWFDYIRLEEMVGIPAKVREVYERAIAQIPPVQEKRLWRRYIYLWLFYAVWEENVAQDLDRTRQVYESLMKLIPHTEFTFAKVWLQYAKFLVRRSQLPLARKTLGMALGKCPKSKLYLGYIDMELQLREFDRVRTLYQKFLEWNPENCVCWIKYSELENSLGDTERARGIFEIAVAQPALDMPEYLWKAYIDFEVGESEWDKAKALYERLLERTEHVKVWVAYARFEYANLEYPDTAARHAAANRLFERAYKTIKDRGVDTSKDERVLLLEAWKEFEAKSGTPDSRAAVAARMPKTIKKRRKVVERALDPATGLEMERETNVWEEYLDYLFPDDETQKPNFKLLQMAHLWKIKQAAAAKAAADAKPANGESTAPDGGKEAAAVADDTPEGSAPAKKPRVATQPEDEPDVPSTDKSHDESRREFLAMLEEA